MRTLVIDTATSRTSVALFQENTLLYSGHHDGATEHAEALPKLVHEALKVNPEIDSIVVGMGPGPFTGLRVGIAFAQAFAHARNIPWFGVCSLDGIDIDAPEYIVTTDARRKEVYWAHYRNGERIEGPAVTTATQLQGREVPIFGFGFTEALFPSPHLLLARSKRAEIREPMYLRRPDAIPTSERT